MVIDECVTAASSIANGVTVRCPEATGRTLRDLVDGSSYLLVMDADFDGDGKGKALLKGIAPEKPVLYIQTTKPSLRTVLFIGYSGLKLDCKAFDERLDLSCLESKEARLAGTPNRTYFGVDWPSTAKKSAKHMREQEGLNVKTLHGQLGQKICDDALADLDAYVEKADVFVTTSKAGIATDQNCKYSAGFMQFNAGDHAPGPRAAGQKIGRLNRNSDKPLDPFVHPDGRVFPGGAIFVLLPGFPPELDRSDAESGELRDRGEKMVYGKRRQVHSRMAAVRLTQSAAEQQYDRRNTALLCGSTGQVARAPSGSRSGIDQGIRNMLEELEAWDRVEDSDKQPKCYNRKFYEMMLLPSRNFEMHHIPHLSDSEQERLLHLQRTQHGYTQTPTEDELVGEMTPEEVFIYVEERVSTSGDSGPDSAFWKDCYGKCETGASRFKGDNIDEAEITVWSTLKDYATFPATEETQPPDSQMVVETQSLKSPTYLDLHKDRNHHNILYRGIMRFISHEQLMLDEVKGCRESVYSDPTVGNPRPAYVLPLLRDFARAIRLESELDLLEPRKFMAGEHEWLDAHNHLVSGGMGDAEQAMARQTRSIAVKLGCTNIKDGPNVKKPTTLVATVYAVLTQRCAMRPPAPGKKNLSWITPEHEWEVHEQAPGFAELGLYWHAGLHEKIPLGEYAQRDARWTAGVREQDLQRQSTDAIDETDAMLMRLGDGDVAMPDANSPYDPSVLYVPYDAAALQECKDAWGAHEPARKSVAAVLKRLELWHIEAHGDRNDDVVLTELRLWQKFLMRFDVRCRTVHDLDSSLPEADDQGARVAREEYRHLADGEARRYSRGDGWGDVDGKWRTATSQGMPNDLLVKLLGWRFADKDGRKSDLVIYVIAAFKLRLRYELVRVLVEEYLISDEVNDAWHKEVAKHHCTEASAVKRWPNILGNGGAYCTCLKEARLPLDSQRCESVQRMEKALINLRREIVRALRSNRDALWHRSEGFFDRHVQRLQVEKPNATDDERSKRFNTVFSYLIETIEDKILSIHTEAQRQAVRDVVGSGKFDALPPERRDTGSLKFDGMLVEVREGVDRSVGDRAAEAALVAQGWHAKPWGITYQIVEKDFYGLYNVAANEIKSANAALDAMEAAAAAYPEVRAAIDAPDAHGARVQSTTSRDAAVIPVRNGRALLTLERRLPGNKTMYGLLGGKRDANETLAATAAREAFEKTGHALSDESRRAIEALSDGAFLWCPGAQMHVAVTAVGPGDDDLPTRFDESLANRPGLCTQLGLVWRDVTDLLNFRFRRSHMHSHARAMILQSIDALKEHAANHEEPHAGVEDQSAGGSSSVVPPVASNGERGVCAICHADLSERLDSGTLGRLDCCSHTFCFDCIKHRVTNQANTCPLCNATVNEISRCARSGIFETMNLAGTSTLTI